MPRSFPCHSFSSSSLSSTSFSSSSSTPASASITRTPSTQRLKQWLSLHLPRRQNPDPDPNLTHHHNNNSKNITKSSNTDIVSQSQQSSTIKPELDQPRFMGLDYDYGYNYDSDTQHHHHHYTAKNQWQQQQRRQGHEAREEDGTLSDNYAAYCRAFTSSPIHFRNLPAQPLPQLPTSASWEECQGPATGPDRNPRSAQGVDVSQIHFQPVGAHGYQPALWALPRPPSPPQGILTPARYEEIQLQQRQEGKLRRDKRKRKRGRLMWCIPTRPWARVQES